ncbi:MAG: response regulator [Pseudomonadales bacterium]|nr:response regulator [Pseudomonadales bacterium]MCP5213951.1 response regulator [Pseudomonadales bacterium]MCP5302839.1 response regulator [Pseudomonadales bacterium]
MLNRVLLVDDSKSARFALRKLLERNGMQVDVAESAEQALGYLDTNHPDLIFMDHFMPGMDGFEAARAIKNRPDKSEIPIIMCTSKEGESYAQQARENGAVDILPKPATPSALTEVLDKLIHNINLHRQELPQEVDMEPQQELQDSPPTLAEHQQPPTLDDVVVPVGQISQIATESAIKAVNECMQERLDELLDTRLPQLRSMVLSNFDKVAKSMLEESVTREVAKVQQLQADKIQGDTKPSLTMDEVERLVQAEILKLREQTQRDLNEQLAEIYSSIGELKTHQELKKVAPELMEDILMRAQDAAAEKANDTLLQASDIAQKAAKQAAEQISQTASSELQGRIDKKLAKAIEAGLESARQEASESAWEKVEQASNQIKAKITKIYVVSGIALALSTAALVGVYMLMS